MITPHDPTCATRRNSAWRGKACDCHNPAPLVPAGLDFDGTPLFTEPSA